MTDRRFFLRPLVAACSLVVLAGCATSTMPISMEERQQSLPEQRAMLSQSQEPLQGPVSLEEALARALKYNLDSRVKLMEEALAMRQFDLSRVDLLPRLTAAAGYTTRNNDLASSSQDFVSGEQSLVPSISSERQRSLVDLGLSWNVLDFGVSYYQSKQNADRMLVAQERRRKTVHQVMQQVRQAYWQMAGAQKMEKRLQKIITDARKALADSRKIQAERLVSPMETLGYQRQLLEIIRQLEAVNDELSQARPRLASLMNLEPGTSFEVMVPEQREIHPLKMSVEQVEEAALLNRPELMEARYNERIGVLETRKAMARLLPGIEFSVGTHYDSNDFLVNKSWRDAGLRVSWNLLNVLNAPAIQGAAKAQEELARHQHMALSMAVLTQSHVAYRDYLSRLGQHELAQELNQVEVQILEQTRNATRTDMQGRLQEVRAAASALVAELRDHHSYASLQGAYGQLLATIGWDPLPAELERHDLAGLRQNLRKTDGKWVRLLGGGS